MRGSIVSLAALAVLVGTGPAEAGKIYSWGYDNFGQVPLPYVSGRPTTGQGAASTPCIGWRCAPEPAAGRCQMGRQGGQIVLLAAIVAGLVATRMSAAPAVVTVLTGGALGTLAYLAVLGALRAARNTRAMREA